MLDSNSSNFTILQIHQIITFCSNSSDYKHLQGNEAALLLGCADLDVNMRLACLRFFKFCFGSFLMHILRIIWIVSGVSNSVLLLRVHYPHKIAREVPAKTLDLVFYEEFSLCQPAIDSVWTKWV